MRRVAYLLVVLVVPAGASLAACSDDADVTGVLADAASDATIVDASAGAPADATPALDVGATAFTWREAASCPLPRFEAMGALVGGELLVMGGFVTESLESTRRVHAYDPATDTWTEKTPLPDSPHHGGVAVVGGSVVLAGGLNPMTAEVFVHDVDADTYFPAASLPSPRAALALLLDDGGVLHAIGGLEADNATDAPEHAVLGDGGWTDLGAAALPNARNHLGGAAIGGKLYVVGGRHGWNEQSGNQATLSVYDVATGAWSAGPDLPLARSEIAASTFAMHGKLVVVGGAQDPAKPTDRVDVYDPAAGAWSSLPPLPGPRKGAVAAAWGDAIVVTTGSPTGVDPAATTWIGCCYR